MSDKKKKYVFFAVQMIGAMLLAVVDQLLKRVAVSHLKDSEDMVLIEDFLAFSYAENTGAAFSSFSNSTTLLSVITLVMLIAVAVYLFVGRIESKLLNICAVLVLGGGIGNLIDRFAQGYVVDYIKTLFIDFPVFNFADILVVVGAFTICGVLIYQIIREEIEKKREKNGESDNGNS